LVASLAGYVIEAGNVYTQDGWENITKDFTVEEAHTDERFFEKYIVSSPHEVYLGMDPEQGPLCFAYETVPSKHQSRLHAILKSKHVRHSSELARSP